MFGKIINRAKNALQKSKKFIGKTLVHAKQGSKFIGKTIDSIQDGYHKAKTYVQDSADNADKLMGTEGAVRKIVNRGVNVLENNPAAYAVSGAIDTLEVQNKLLNSKVLQNKDLNRFVNS